MNSVIEHIRTHLLESLGVVSEAPVGRPSLDALRVSEWSPEFETLMRNRMIMGAFRYGLLHRDNKPKYDHITSAIVRLQKFQESGNAEHLVDVANMCLLTFVERQHPNFHFSSADDGYHTPLKEDL